ncbi:MAG: hypothetical protein GX447_02880 [Elusimicrobia bacterium]|nr:hypothetical protein [Elusimicrobiota bacterium]
MRIPFFLYILILIISFIAVLFAADRISKSKSEEKRNADIGLGDMFFLGFSFIFVFSIVTIFAFTGLFSLLLWGVMFIAFLSLVLYAYFLNEKKQSRLIKEDMLNEREKAAYTTATKDPLNAAAWRELAEIYTEKKDYLKALNYMSKACELEPSKDNKERKEEIKNLIKS